MGIHKISRQHGYKHVVSFSFSIQIAWIDHNLTMDLSPGRGKHGCNTICIYGWLSWDFKYQVTFNGLIGDM